MNKDTKTLLTWLAAAVLIIGSFLAIMFSGGGDDGTTSNGASLSNVDPVAEWSKGNEQAKVVLVEFSDFQCPACKSRVPLIEELMKEFGDHVALVYRHFPLKSIHQNAQMAAQASEAAGQQGKFWEMHDALFENQENWSSLSSADAKNAFISYAEGLALDIAKFTGDLDSSETKNAVDRDTESGNAIGVNSTPSFALQGKLINPRSLEEYRTMIRSAIEESTG